VTCKVPNSNQPDWYPVIRDYQAPGVETYEFRVGPDFLRCSGDSVPRWDGNDFLNMPLVIIAQGKCSTGP
jgi:hypothetical protein